MKHLLSCLLICIAITGFAQEKKKTIAVLEFASTGDISKKEVITLTKRFRDMLVQTNSFKVLERDKMDAILKEQDFILSDDCNSAECAVQVGQLLGVEKMITGDIGNVGNTWTIGLRMIDMSSGEIERTETLDFQGAIDGMLEVMRQAAYVFAGLQIPKGKSVFYFKDNSLKSASTPSHLHGRIRIGIHTEPGFWLNSNGRTAWLLNTKTWKAKNPDRKMDFNAHLGVSIGYMFTPRLKMGVEVSILEYIYDTTANGNWSNKSPYLAHPATHTMGINFSYFLTPNTTNVFKPYIQARIGYYIFENKMDDLDYGSGSPIETEAIKSLPNRTGIFFSPALGMDIRLFRHLNFQIMARAQFMKPFNTLVMVAGFEFCMGKPFPETKK
jgi:TolB-like protein